MAELKRMVKRREIRLADYLGTDSLTRLAISMQLKTSTGNLLALHSAARDNVLSMLDALKEKHSLIHHDVAGHAEKEDTLLAASHRLGDSLDELERWLKRQAEAGRKAA